MTRAKIYHGFVYSLLAGLAISLTWANLEGRAFAFRHRWHGNLEHGWPTIYLVRPLEHTVAIGAERTSVIDISSSWPWQPGYPILADKLLMCVNVVICGVIVGLATLALRRDIATISLSRALQHWGVVLFLVVVTAWGWSNDSHTYGEANLSSYLLLLVVVATIVFRTTFALLRGSHLSPEKLLQLAAQF